MRIKALVEFQGGDVAQVAPTDTVKAANDKMAGMNIGALAVTADGTVVGIISERDVARGISRAGAGFLDESVQAAMSKNVITCTGDMPVREVTQLLCDNRIRHIPVLEDGHLVGMASIRDILGSYVERVYAEYDAMEEQLGALTQ
ncbi:MAG: CBS domain-containing protein [Rhodospirillales bacterium]|nr:CBS domain-containing protein [Rhodospirillales bacterium]MBO6788337.1 CBS domain-containing protein [Rhodospirillales bacterium]